MVIVGVPFVSCVSAPVSAQFSGNWLTTPPMAMPGVMGPPTTQALYFNPFVSGDGGFGHRGEVEIILLFIV